MKVTKKRNGEFFLEAKSAMYDSFAANPIDEMAGLENEDAKGGAL